MRAVVVVFLFASACADRDWAGLYANDPNEERTYRGPCIAAQEHPDGTRFVAYRYTQDADEMWRDDNPDEEDLSTTYRYADDGSYAEIVRNEGSFGTNYRFVRTGSTYEYGSTYPTYRRTAEYDASIFQLAPAVGVQRERPRAIIGLVRTYDFENVVETYTWERTATGMRRTDTKGNTFDVELDERDRIVGYALTENGMTVQYHYRYEGDLLVERRYGTSAAERVERYRYDDGGNLIASGDDTIYRYDCWD